MARKKKSTVATAVASASARAAAAAETAVLGADWVATLREVMQDVQTLALERTGYQDASQTHLHTASLAPALRRLRRVFKDEVGFGSALVEENWVLFRDEIWLAIVRVLVTRKLSAAVVHAFGAFFGEFLSAFTPREAARSSTGGGPLGSSSSSCIKKKRPEDTPTSKARRDRESSLNELRMEILNRLLDATKAEDKHVRLRVCHFLQLLLNKLDFIEEEMFTKLRETLIPRANDKLASVRVQGVYALKRIQEPDDAKDAVTAELLRLMVSDPSKDVRRAAVLSVAITKAAYKDLLIRIRDTSDDVRHAVFQVFGDAMSIRDIPINDRAHLLDQGLQDRSELVRRACQDMVLTKWLPTCRDSPIALLKALDIEQFPTIGAKVSRIILEHLSANPQLEDAVPHNALEILAQNSDGCDAESIFFWREQCLYYQTVDRDLDKVAALLPNISDFCKLVVVACEAGAEMFFIAQQLLALGHLLDFQDEFGRRKLLDCLQKMLRNIETETELISSIMELMACIHAGTSDQEFIQVVAEITSDLYDPLEEADDEERSGPAPAASSLSSLTPEERDAAAHRFEELEAQLATLDEDSTEYSDVQSEMFELEKLLQDPDVLRRLRCLEVVAQLLKLTASTLRDPTIAGMGRYILPAIESDVPAVREAGMEALGLFCLLDKTFAEKHMLVFWRALSNDDEERDVKLNCIKALFDMLFSFANLSPKSLVPIKTEPTDSDGVAVSRVDALDLETVLFGLAELLLVDDLDVQSTIVEGFGKLFLLNRIQNVAVLALLLETFFSPALQRVQLMGEHGYQSRALQLLSVFFPAFARASRANCALLEEASIHLVQKTLEKDDFGDSATTLDLSAAVKYAAHLLSHAEQQATAPLPCAHHNRMGLHMCMDLLALEHIAASEDAAIDAEQVVSRQKTLVKALLLVDVSPDEPRSAALFNALLADVAATCFRAQRRLVRSAEAFAKRTVATLGDAARSGDVLAQDCAWAKQHVMERAETLVPALRDATKLEAQRRKLAKKKRRPGKFSSSESDDESDDDESDDDESDDGARRRRAPAAVPPRELSTRKSKQVATERIANREFDVKMKIAFESDDESGASDESDEVSDDDESSAADDE